MNDNQERKQPLGIYHDPAGDLSSGRMMKLQAFWTAIVLTVTGLGIVTVLSVMNLTEAAAEVGGYLEITIGAYLAVATGAEIVQKTTGR